MENYVISEDEELINAEPPFPHQYVGPTVKVMNINKNTKFAHIIDHVNKSFEDESNRYVIFRGVGDAADKCISCVEVFKKKAKEPFYQWNKLAVARRVTYWNPIIEGMDRLKVTVDTPVMFILVSRDQFPVDLQCLSMQFSKEKSGAFVSGSLVKGSGSKSNKPSLKPKEGPNKWMRSDKNAKDARHAENAERARIRKEVSTSK